jgi:hypothetical protein
MHNCFESPATSRDSNPNDMYLKEAFGSKICQHNIQKKIILSSSLSLSLEHVALFGRKT